MNSIGLLSHYILYFSGQHFFHFYFQKGGLIQGFTVVLTNRELATPSKRQKWYIPGKWPNFKV